MAKYFVRPEHLIQFDGKLPEGEVILVKSLARFGASGQTQQTKPRQTKPAAPAKPAQLSSTNNNTNTSQAKKDRASDGLSNEFELTFDEEKKDQVSVEVHENVVRVIVNGQIWARKAKNESVAKISAEKLRDGISQLSVSKLIEVLGNTPGMELLN